MRKSHEIAADLRAKVSAFEAETDAAKRAELAAEVESLTQELREAQIDEACQRALLSQRQLDPAQQKELRRFSIAKFLREAAAGKLEGLEAEMDQEARHEVAGSGRSVEGFGLPSMLLGVQFAGTRGTYNNATDAEYGKALQTVTDTSYVASLKDAMVGARAGVRYIPGMQGIARIVKGGSATASWLTEEASATLSKINYKTVDLSPKRLQILCGYTMDLLKQSSLAVEQLIWDELIAAHAQSLDSAIFNGSGTAGEPVGILNDENVAVVEMGTNGGTATWPKMVAMETKVGANNALFGSLAYVTNSKVAGDLKTIAKVSNTAVFLMEANRMNGYPVLTSNAIPSNLTKGTADKVCSAALFGNFNEVVVPQWGGLDFLVDPYSQKAKAVIEATAIAYHDVCVRRPEAFCKCVDIKTAA